MSLNSSNGNMYNFCDLTWNPVKSKHPQGCVSLRSLRFDKKELIDLGKNNGIFVGSSCDLFAENIPNEWIVSTLEHCRKYSENQYFFQSKNPVRIYLMKEFLPLGSIILTTIETNRCYPQMAKAPHILDRVHWMNMLSLNFKTMVTIEPVMDFDVLPLVDLVRKCNPFQVNIGADSKGNNLTEPAREKIEDLKRHLAVFTEVKLESSLARLMV